MNKLIGLEGPKKSEEPDNSSEIHGIRMYSAREVSEMFGVHERSITGWAKAGKIGHYSIEGRKVFSRADIDDYLRKNHHPAREHITSLGKAPLLIERGSK